MKRMSGRERRDQIVEAAYGVIIENGLAGTSTRNVTQRLGVGSGLLHHYFDTWKSLRAEVVGLFISREIGALKASLEHMPPDQLVAYVVDWMVQDPQFRHWKLWLDAIEEARRDAELAAVVATGYVRWQETIRDVLVRTTAAGHGNCRHADEAAWRISALIDGLVGMLASGQTPLSKTKVQSLLRGQFSMELQTSGAA